MNGYVCFYRGKRVEVQAETQLKARDKAIEIFKPKASDKHMVAVVLAEVAGKQVEHAPVD